LRPLLKEITPEQEVYIVNPAGNIIYTQNLERIDQPITNYYSELPFDKMGAEYSGILHYDGVDRIVSAIPSSRNEWFYLSIVPLEHYETRQTQLRSFLIFLISIGIGSSLIIAFLISVQTYQPIRGILNLLDRAHPPMRDFRKQSPGSVNEIKYIA